jgi:hypothetical protein
LQTKVADFWQYLPYRNCSDFIVNIYELYTCSLVYIHWPLNCVLIKTVMQRPGIEPGPPSWQASILPLNQRCLLLEEGLFLERFFSNLFPKSCSFLSSLEKVEGGKRPPNSVWIWSANAAKYLTTFFKDFFLYIWYLCIALIYIK